MAYRRSALMEERLAGNRERILHAARALIAEGGYRNAPVTAVAAVAGVSTGCAAPMHLTVHLPCRSRAMAAVLNSLALTDQSTSKCATAAQLQRQQQQHTHALSCIGTLPCTGTAAVARARRADAGYAAFQCCKRQYARHTPSPRHTRSTPASVHCPAGNVTPRYGYQLYIARRGHTNAANNAVAQAAKNRFASIAARASNVTGNNRFAEKKPAKAIGKPATVPMLSASIRRRPNPMRPAFHLQPATCRVSARPLADSW